MSKTRRIPSVPYQLPLILSREEVAHLIGCALTPVHRMMLMTLYATGIRRAELANLKLSDIDSQTGGRSMEASWNTFGHSSGSFAGSSKMTKLMQNRLRAVQRLHLVLLIHAQH